MRLPHLLLGLFASATSQDQLFDTFSVLSSIAAVFTLWQLCQQWSSFWDEIVTPLDANLAARLALFVLVPLGVLGHEFGHALAVWQLGGQVLKFQWRIFWGYVLPQGTFTPLGSWWIAFSGNLVSIVLGLLALGLLSCLRQPILRVLCATFARIQLVYALVGYPLWSVGQQFGDWVIIYDFDRYPYAYWVLGGHLLLLGGLWLLDRKTRQSLAPSSNSHAH